MLKRIILTVICWTSVCTGITLHVNMESTLPTPDSATTYNTPSPINVPPTSSSSSSVKRITMHQQQQTPKISTAAFTTTMPSLSPTTLEFTNENNTFNSLQPTELPTDPMPLEESQISQNHENQKVIRVTTKKKSDEPDYVRVRLPGNLTEHLALSKQIPAITTDPLGFVDVLVSRNPCNCDEGICKCCTGMIMSAFNSKGCAMIKYIPEEFSFEFRMLMNNNVLYKNRVSGKNPPPICVNPRRLPFLEVCANFYDIYFIGRNMHLCLEINGSFNGFDVFNRNFECMHFGTSGVGVASAGDNSALPSYGGDGVDAEVDAGPGDEIDDYDENVRSI